MVGVSKDLAKSIQVIGSQKLHHHLLVLLIKKIFVRV